MNKLHTQVGAALARGLGQVLVGIDYMCFPSEVAHALDASELDGEVALHFESAPSLYMTWTQNSGWLDVNSLIASSESQFRPGTLTRVPANSHALWATHIGSKMVGAEVLGWQGTPSIARLHFSHGSVLVGVGRESAFRDGDCVLIRSDEPKWLFAGEFAVTLWRT